MGRWTPKTWVDSLKKNGVFFKLSCGIVYSFSSTRVLCFLFSLFPFSPLSASLPVLFLLPNPLEPPPYNTHSSEVNCKYLEDRKTVNDSQYPLNQNVVMLLHFSEVILMIVQLEDFLSPLPSPLWKKCPDISIWVC